MPNTPPDNLYGSRALMGRLWRDYLRPHAGWMVLAAIFMVIEGSTLGLLSYVLQPMFDRVFVGRDHSAIWWVGGAVFGLFALRAFTYVVQQAILTRVSQWSSTAIQKDLMRHLLTLDSVFFQKTPPGALMERVQGDTLAVQDVWKVVLSGVGRDAVALISLFVVALTIDWRWTLVAVMGAPLLVLPTVMLQRYIRRKASYMRDRASQRSTRLDEMFHGVNPIKLNLMEAYQARRFDAIIAQIVGAEVKTATMRAMLPALVDIITGLGFFGVLILGGQEVISGDKTVGQFMSFFTAMALTFQPLRRLGAVAGVWQVAAASLERIYRLLDEQPTITSPAKPAKPVPREKTELQLRDVQFAYDDQPVLRGTTFTAEAGKTTALVGASGAGKSTVFNLLTRLIDPQKGTVSVGGVPTRSLALPDLRGLFSVVTQDALLFDETIRENILLGRSDISDGELTKVLKAAHVDDFLKKLPLGLDTPAGPRGANLSGGQRQRVAIARALVRNTPILLLDEATSALDAQSEAVVQKALEELSRGRTTLVIAHRLSTIQGADKIVVMDQGRVADQGTHKELLERGGIYAELHRLQFKTEGPSADILVQGMRDRRQTGSGSDATGSMPPDGTNLFGRIWRRWFGR